MEILDLWGSTRICESGGFDRGYLESFGLIQLYLAAYTSPRYEGSTGGVSHLIFLSKEDKASALILDIECSPILLFLLIGIKPNHANLDSPPLIFPHHHLPPLVCYFIFIGW